MDVMDLISLIDSSAREQASRDPDKSNGGRGFYAVRHTAPTQRVAMVYDPTICLVVQGSKDIYLGESAVRLGQGDALIVSHDLPVVYKIREASPAAPYLAAIIPIDLEVLRSLNEKLEDVGFDYRSRHAIDRSIASPALVDAVGRYAQLDGNEIEGRVLRPIIFREIHYHLLIARNGGMLRQLMSPGSASSRISRAIRKIRENYRSPLSVSDLAETACMSVSTFHQHFKSVTGTSPMRYQKELRLIDARRLLTIGANSVSEVCFAVGYENLSQFSREYSRKFGVSPRHDLGRT
ncbi:MAG: AraC family transcriptional regulator [Methyloceanibacter sp.]|nr:AraC family transcriptional regulator [Methyloceanibacter sp.]